MPKMGESITEGTILEWKKNIGDTIALDETLLEISTDKVDSEVPSPAAGVITELLFSVNDVVEVGTVIARVGGEGEAPVKKSPEVVKEAPKVEEVAQAEKTVEVVPVSPSTSSGEGGRFYSPLVKSIAKTEGISSEELDSISGSGKDGRVNKHDMMAYLENRGNAQLVTPAAVPLPHIPATPVQPIATSTPGLTDNIEPMGRMRKKIAQHMLASQQTSPHVYSTTEVDVTNLVNYRAQSKDAFLEKYGVKLTYTPMILDACIKGIQEFPLMNASIDGDNIVHHQKINMGVAVALPDNNLIVPAIKASEEKNFLGLTRATADLAARARINKLEPDEIFGSTFTVTNPGIFGSLFGMAIINQPNVGILSVGSIQKKPVVKETEFGDVIVIRSMMYITLGYDHRLIDGAYGTRFLSRVTELIEAFDGSDIKL
ncbi:MAG: 2-oxo acid dehydrogenase subunit E2 [Candidatus Marinimicrobia bacterium]|nr:2-oxo acid dehydrogenase subunit E2 [Candidatus Neomarinimicrobiota bacterium]